MSGMDRIKSALDSVYLSVLLMQESKADYTQDKAQHEELTRLVASLSEAVKDCKIGE